MTTKPAPTTFDVDLNDVVADLNPASCRRNGIALTTSTHYGFGMWGHWDQLPARNGFRTRYIARQDGAAVWLYNRRPNEWEDTAARLYFGSGAVVQFKPARDPMFAVEVVFPERRLLKEPSCEQP